MPSLSGDVAVSGPIRKSERTRLALLNALRAELQATGSYSAESVTRRAGSSTATFYNHFESKDEALDAAFALLMSELLSMVESGLSIELVLERGLHGFGEDWLRNCVQFFRANSVLFRAAQARSLLSPAIEEIYAHSEALAISHCERFIRLGQAAGVFREGEAAAMARGMMILAEGYNNPAVLRLSAGDGLHDELVRCVVQLLATTGETL